MEEYGAGVGGRECGRNVTVRTPTISSVYVKHLTLHYVAGQPRLFVLSYGLPHKHRERAVDLEPSPLSTVDAESLKYIFEADPLTLTDAQLEGLVIELRRRRNAFTAEEAAKASKGKSARTKAQPQPASASATLDKPTAEIDLDDLT